MLGRYITKHLGQGIMAELKISHAGMKRILIDILTGKAFGGPVMNSPNV